MEYHPLVRSGLFFAMLAFFFWGFWGFFSKLATRHVSPASALFYYAATLTILSALIVLFWQGKFEGNPKGLMFSALVGCSAALGTLFFFISLTKTQTAVAVTVTALYPIVTMLLAVLFLGESITLKQGAGIFFALLAMGLFAH
jgi:transporter family protein